MLPVQSPAKTWPVDC